MNEDGFEYQGVFYPWQVSDVGKDLRLIDHFTGMPISNFFEAVQDSFDNGRGPILLALLATSIRHKRQDWSFERISRMVDGISLSEVEFIAGGEGDEQPPPSAGEQPAGKQENPSTSSDPPNGSAEPTLEPSFASRV